VGHVTRLSDSSLFDEICVNCGATDRGHDLDEPCSRPGNPYQTIEEYYRVREGRCSRPSGTAPVVS